jgi:phenylalanyl-tRNA synthetase beta chain
MIFSEEWLKEWIDPQMGTDILMEKLTMAGLESDGSSAVAYDFTGIVVGEVLTVESHPDAKKLQVCKVSDGANAFQVVCGASNVRVGLKAPFATVGSEITIRESKEILKIQIAKIRGVQSNGMLCSSEELGLEEKSEGLLELSNSSVNGALNWPFREKPRGSSLKGRKVDLVALE